MFLETFVPSRPASSSYLNLMDFLFYHWPKEDPKPPAAWRPKKNSQGEVVGAEIQLALAGFKEEDLSVYASGRQLVVEGSNMDREDVNLKWRAEFSKKFSLQERLDIKNAEVEFYDGLLSISIPLEESAKKAIPLFGKK